MKANNYTTLVYQVLGFLIELFMVRVDFRVQPISQFWIGRICTNKTYQQEIHSTRAHKTHYEARNHRQVRA